jgi:hypothetical protein
MSTPPATPAHTSDDGMSSLDTVPLAVLVLNDDPRANGHACLAAAEAIVASVDITDAEQLCSVLVPMLFRVSLTLHGAAAGADDVTASRVLDAVDDLDDVIASLRRAALDHLHRRMADSHPDVVLTRLEEAIDQTEAALQTEWAEAWDSSAASGAPGEPAQLVRVVQLLRGARRMLDADAIG